MPNYTTNYNLEKPLGTENYDVKVQNGNMDKIDTEIVKKENTANKGQPNGYAALDADGKVPVAQVPDVSWVNITDKPTNFTPSAHKSTHAAGGSDALTPADIGAHPKILDANGGVWAWKIDANNNAYLEQIS